MTGPDPIIVHTIRDSRTLACPLCDFTIDVPDVPVNDQVGATFGMSGHTLAMVHAEQIAKRVSDEMHHHLKAHQVLDWLPLVARAETLS